MTSWIRKVIIPWLRMETRPWHTLKANKSRCRDANDEAILFETFKVPSFAIRWRALPTSIQSENTNLRGRLREPIWRARVDERRVTWAPCTAMDAGKGASWDDGGKRMFICVKRGGGRKGTRDQWGSRGCHPREKKEKQFAIWRISMLARI